MKRRLASLVAAVFVVSVLSGRASAVPRLPEKGLDERVAWEPAWLVGPVDPARLGTDDLTWEARAPHDDFTVGPGRAFALWLPTLSVARVKALEGDGQIRFARVAGGEGAGAGRLVLAERGTALRRDTWLLTQPAGGGDTWVVWSDAPRRLSVERPRVRRAVLAWESARAALLRWVDEGGEMPPLPMAAGVTEATSRLAIAAEIGALLEAHAGSDVELSAAIGDWRKALAIEELERLRPLGRSFFRRHVLTTQLPGYAAETHLLRATGDVAATEPVSKVPYQPVREAGSWDIVAPGPGILRLDVRGLDRGRHVVTLSCGAGERLATRHRRAVFYPRPAHVSDPSAPSPGAAPVPLVTESGAWVGPRTRLTVVTREADERCRVTLEGGPVLVRLEAGRRRPWLDELPHGGEDVLRLLARARARARNMEGPARALFARLVDRALGAAPVSSTPAGARLEGALAVLGRPLDAFGEEIGAQDLVDTVAAELAAREDLSPLLEWYVRLLTLERLQELAAPAELSRRVVRDARCMPPPGLVAALLPLLPDARLSERFRSRVLAVLDLAWRSAPFDAALRRAYLDVWQMASRWSRLAGHIGRGPRARLVDAQSWLALPAPGAEVGSPRSGALVPVPSGECAPIALPFPAQSEARHVRLRLYVATPPWDAGPYRVRIDDRAWSGLAMKPVEVVDLAVHPGRHCLAVDGPAAGHVFAAATLLEPPAGASAHVHSLWPLRVGHRNVRFAVPDAAVPGPLRLVLRAPDGSGRKDAPRAIRVHTDTEPPRELTWLPGGHDTRALPIEGQRGLGVSTEVVLDVPPGTSEIRVEAVDGAPALAAVYVRRVHHPIPRSEAPSAATPSASSAASDIAPGDDIQRLDMLSKRIAASADPAAILERAGLLLDLGEERLAREDAVRLVRAGVDDPRSELRPALEDLLERLSETHEGHPLHLASELTAAVIPIRPGGLALGGGDAAFSVLAGWKPTVQALREHPDAVPSPRAVSASTPLDVYMEARVLALARGERWAAAQRLAALYRETGAWQVGLEGAGMALDALGVGEKTPSAGGAVWLYGLATELARHGDLPAARRAMVRSASWSRWTRVSRFESEAGFEQLYVPGGARTPRPRRAIREALIVPPWPPRGSRTLSRGASAVLDIRPEGHTAVRADLHCAPLSPDLCVAGGGCRFRTRRNGETASETRVRCGAVRSVAFGRLSAGRNVLEVSLLAAPLETLGTVRFVADRPIGTHRLGAPETDGYPVETLRPMRMFVARRDRPVALTVAGPAVLRLEARGVSYSGPSGLAAGASSILVKARGLGDVDDVNAEVRLDPHSDARVEGDPERNLTVSRARREHIFLPEVGRYRVTLRPNQATALVGLWLREDTGRRTTASRPAWWTRVDPKDALFPWPRVPSTVRIADVTEHAATPAWDVGMLSGELFGVVSAHAAPAGGDVRLRWRRRLDPLRLWIRLGPTLRAREGREPVWGGRADAYVAELPWDLRLRGAFQGLAQGDGSGDRYRLSGWAKLDRSFLVAEDWRLLPAVRFWGAHQGLRGEVAALEDEPIDPLVFSDHVEQLSLSLTPRVSAWWRPLQDHRFVAGAEVTVPADFHTFDAVRARLGWRGIVPLAGGSFLTGRLDALPGYVSDTTGRSYRGFEQRLGVGLGWWTWLGGGGRLGIVLDSDLRVGESGATRETVQLGVRVDWSGGRGLRDLLPDEEVFRTIAGQRWWSSDDATDQDWR